MAWDVYNVKTDLHDGSYSSLSDARFYRMVHTVLWKGSEWEIKERIDDPNDKHDISIIRGRFHADYKDLLRYTFGEPQYELLAKVEKAEFLFNNVRWFDEVLVFESYIKEETE